MPTLDMLLQHAFGLMLFGLSSFAWQGRLLAPPGPGRADQGRYPRGSRTLGRMLATLLALAATTAFGQQVGWVATVQLTALFASIGYVVVFGIAHLVSSRQVDGR